MSDLTRVERLKLMAEGQKAFRAGKDSTDCPYRLGSDKTAQQAAAWVRGYVTTRHIDGGDKFEDKPSED